MNFPVCLTGPPHRTNLYIYDPLYKKQSEAKYIDAKDYVPEKHIISSKDRYFFNRKTRWANLGFHYDWDNRCYFKDSFSTIPDPFKLFATKINAMLKLQEYNPEAVIVNYYSDKDYMGGHLDDGEPDQTHPIVSISIGLSAVFMIGGITKDEPPLSLLLESGDVCVMSKFSRLCYHGVPKVLAGTFKIHDSSKIQKMKLEREFSDEIINLEYNALQFLSENRLNANFRQVLFESDK